jgi:hypothetical protein
MFHWLRMSKQVVTALNGDFLYLARTSNSVKAKQAAYATGSTTNNIKMLIALLPQCIAGLLQDEISVCWYSFLWVRDLQT